MSCKEYHEWEVVDIAGTLPHQEVELQCRNCDAVHLVIFDY